MSLYGRTDAKQRSALDSLMPPPGIPTWLLAIAGYLALVTIINNASDVIEWFENGLLRDEHMLYVVATSTGLLSVVALLLFVFRRYTLCIYYLVVMSIIESGLAIASIAGKAEDLNPYFYLLQGLNSVPTRIIILMVGWDNISENVKQVVKVAGPVISLAACALLLYFHAKRPSNVQR